MGNSSNAYATVKPIDVSLSDTIVKQQELGFKRRAERREVEDIKTKQEDKNKIESDKIRERNQVDWSMQPSEYSSLGEVQLSLLKMGQDDQYKSSKEYDDLKKKSIKTPEDEKRIFDLEYKLNNYKTSFVDNIKNFTEASQKELSDVVTGVKNGNYFKEDDFDEKIGSKYLEGKGFKPSIDDKGNPAVAFGDADGDGVLDIVSMSNITPYFQGLKMQKVNLNKLAYDLGNVTSLHNETVREKRDKDNPYITHETEDVTQEDAEKAVEQLLSDVNIRSYMRMNKDKYKDYNQSITPELTAEIKTEIAKDYLSATKKVDKTKYNSADQNADESLAETKKQHRISNALNKDKWKTMKKKAENDDKTPRISGTTVPSVNTWGKGAMNLIDTKTTRAVNISKGGVKLKAIKTNTTKNDKQFIISDGICEDHESLKRVLRQAQEEQIMIGNILSDMDTEIITLEIKLDKYKKIKLGMMQNLLTGKIRLIN